MAAPEAFLKDDVRCKPELDGLGALGDLVCPICLSTYLCNPFPVQAVISAKSPHARSFCACAGALSHQASWGVTAANNSVLASALFAALLPVHSRMRP